MTPRPHSSLRTLLLPLLLALASACSTESSNEEGASGGNAPSSGGESASGGEGGGDANFSSGGSGEPSPNPEAGKPGATCAMGDHKLPAFSGYTESEVTIQVSTPECESEICLVNHAQGRVDCPYGQTEADLELPATDPQRCTTPTGEPVETAVEPQIVTRRLDDQVYCSCRCAGPDADAEYCTCPTGMVCEPLVEELGLGKSGLAGSYCITEGSEYNAGFPSTETCDRDLKNCE